jgi:hypothetical protein
MIENSEPVTQAEAPQPKVRRRLRIKPTDIVIIVVFLAIVVGLVVYMSGRLALKHEVTGAKATSDKVIAALAKQDTAAIRATGDKQFQAKNSAESLDTALTFHPENSKPIKFGEMYGNSNPTVDQQLVVNNTNGQHVLFIYKYSKLKVPFYVRVIVAKGTNDTKWTLQGLSASSNESSLLTAK